MKPDPKRIRELFVAAVGMGDPRRWEVFLEHECSGDQELLGEVRLLLDAHREAGSFLKGPAVDLAATGDSRTAPAPGDRSLEAAAPDRSGTVIGPYKLLQPIGEGGMGTVFLAEQTHPVRRKVALKVIKAGMDSRQVIARFEAERQALAMMDHVNIARVLDAGATESGRPYFVMELVHGVPITSFCDGNRLTPRERLELFVPVCRAIQHAHQKGIIHRDIKPSNVMITLDDGRPVPKVIDFGVAKAIDQRLTDRTLFTQYGTIVGTLEYMSPEQAEMSALGADTRSDIYSLGVLLYELLTGSTPLTRKRVREAAYGEVLRMIKEEEPPRPSTRLSDSGESLASISAQRHTEPARLTKLMRGELDWIVMRTLEKDRGRRYETVNGFAADLQCYLSDEPVKACPPSATYRFRKFARRNKAALTVAAVVLAAMVLALVVLTISNVWVAGERDQKARALRDKDQALQKEIVALGKAREQEDLARENAGEARKQQGIARGEADRAKEQELSARRHFYAAQILLAQKAYGEGQLSRVLDLLETQRPRFDQRDLRGFEWYYLWRLCHHGRRFVSRGQNMLVHSVAFSPDGMKLASAGRQLIIWDVATGEVATTIPTGIPGIDCLVFSPDGKKLAVSGARTVKLLDSATGKLLATLEGQTDIVWSMAFSPDGKRLVSGSQDTTVRLWDVASGELLATLQGHGNPVMFVALPADGQTVASWSWEGKAILWDVPARKPRFTLPGQSPIALSSAGTLAFAGKLWDVKTGQPGAALPELGAGTAVFSPDGKALALGSGDRNVKLLDLKSGRIRPHHAHRLAVNSVAFSPDGTKLASGGDDNVQVWETASSAEGDDLPRPGTQVVAFSANGKTLAIGGSERIVLWDMPEAKERLSMPGKVRYRNLALSADGKTVACVAADPTVIELRDTTTGKELVTLTGHKDPVVSLALSPDGTKLASAGADGARIWDLLKRECRFALPVGNILQVAFSPDGKLLAVCGQFNTLRVFDPETGEGRGDYGEQGSAHYQSMLGLAFSPDSMFLAASGSHGYLNVWDLDKARLHVSMKGHSDTVTTVGFSADGQTLASADGNGIKLWDVVTGQERLTLKGGAGSLAFSPTSPLLVSALPGDKVVRLRRAAEDREAVAPRTELDASEPDSPLALVKQGDVLGGRGRPEDAAIAYRAAASRLEKLAAELPREPECRREMAAAYNALGLLFKANGRIPEAEQAHERARLVLEKLVADFPDVNLYRHDLTRSHWCLGDLRQAAGRHAEAEQAFGRAIALNPQDPETWIKRASAYKARDDWAKARADYSRVIELDPRHAFAWHSLGHVYGSLGQREKAIAHLTRAIELVPDSPSYWTHRGEYYAGLGQLTEAIADFSKGIELKPDDAFLWRDLARLQEEAGRWNEAIVDYSNAMRLHPGDWGLWDDRGMAYQRVNQPEKALADFTKSLAIYAGASWVWAHRGLLLSSLGLWEEARADLSKAIELQPDDAGYKNHLAWLLVTCPDTRDRNPKLAVRRH